jgi:predicted metal-dependent HD superfamily phosphohydrolase
LLLPGYLDIVALLKFLADERYKGVLNQRLSGDGYQKVIIPSPEFAAHYIVDNPDLESMTIERIGELFGIRAEFFEALHDTRKKEQTLESYIAEHPDMKEASIKIEEAISELDLRARSVAGEKNAEVIQQAIRKTIEQLYQELPPLLFRKYYLDQGMIAAHTIMHGFGTMHFSMDILAENKDAEESESLDYRLFTVAAFTHDICYLLYGKNHEETSAIWIESLLKKNGNFSDEEISTIYTTCLGHRKVKSNAFPRTEHRLFAAKLLHDADLLDGIINGNERIYKIKHQAFFRRELTVRKRKALLDSPNYEEGDSVTELIRKACFQREPMYFLTLGGRSLMHSDKYGKESGYTRLLSYIYEKEGDILIRCKEGPKFIDLIITAIQETYKACCTLQENTIDINAMKSMTTMM